MERKRFTIAGAEFSAPNPVGSIVYARLKENASDDLRALGAKDKDIESESEWFKWLQKLLSKKPTIGSLRILESLLRPESGVSVLDAFESDTKGEVAEPLNFFTESMKILLPDRPASVPGSPVKSARRQKPRT